jgi:hypothetical protein
MIFINLLVLRRGWTREKGGGHCSVSGHDARSEEVATTLFDSDREVCGFAGQRILIEESPSHFVQYTMNVN